MNTGAFTECKLLCLRVPRVISSTVFHLWQSETAMNGSTEASYLSPSGEHGPVSTGRCTSTIIPIRWSPLVFIWRHIETPNYRLLKTTLLMAWTARCGRPSLARAPPQGTQLRPQMPFSVDFPELRWVPFRQSYNIRIHSFFFWTYRRIYYFRKFSVYVVLVWKYANTCLSESGHFLDPEVCSFSLSLCPQSSFKDASLLSFLIRAMTHPPDSSNPVSSQVTI